jgi:CRISPR-associated protein Csb2
MHHAEKSSSFKAFDHAFRLKEYCEILTIARYSLDSQSPPLLTEILSFAENIHSALVSLSRASPVFTGCDSSGRPLLGHRHAYILCESNEANGRGKNGEITEVSVFAPMGFGHRERMALQSISTVWGMGGGAIRLTLQGIGQLEENGGLDLASGSSPLFAKAKTWVSRTPFIPTRHPKVTRAGEPKVDASGLQIGGPEHELRRLLLLAGFPAPLAVEAASGTEIGGRTVFWESFRLARGGGGGRRAAYGRGYGFRIRFPVPVRGPLALGYGAHFGMGGFGAVAGTACTNH